MNAANTTSEAERKENDPVAENPMAKMVDTYDAYMRNITLGREQALRDLTVRLAQVKPGDSVLEVGCGTGTLTLAAKRKAGPTGQVVGIDVLPGMVAASRKKALHARADVAFQLGGIDAIPFPAAQFDVVMCSFMIFHMPEETRRKGISEIRRVLKPNGRLLVVDLAARPGSISRFIASTFMRGMLEHELSELFPALQSAGFSQIETGQVKFRIMGLSLIGYVRASVA